VIAKIIYEYSGEPVVTCRSCPCQIFFPRNLQTGKAMPVECESLEPHWGNCPGAAKFRKPKDKAEGE
jgi:hypothetical protein